MAHFLTAYQRAELERRATILGLFEDWADDMLIGQPDRNVFRDRLTKLVGGQVDVLLERARQIAEEGFDAAHDDDLDDHGRGQIAAAAAAYAFAGSLQDHVRTLIEEPNSHAAWIMRLLWPSSWDGWFKPKDRRRDLVRAGALIIAEIERLDRAAARSKAA